MADFPYIPIDVTAKDIENRVNLPIDTKATSGSKNLITSGAVYNASSDKMVLLNATIRGYSDLNSLFINPIHDVEEVIFNLLVTGLAEIYPIVGGPSFIGTISGDTLLITNKETGEKWLYVKDSSRLEKYLVKKGGIEGGSVTPWELDRKYWEYLKSSFVETAYGLLNMLTEETKVMRIKALKDSSMYYWLGDDDALALKTNEGMLVINLCNGKTYKLDPEGGGLAEIDKINDGDINREYLFSEDMREKFLSLPVSKVTAEELYDTENYNALTTPGIYQIDTNDYTEQGHEVVIVLRPISDFHLMQIKFSHNKVEYRSCFTDAPNLYFDTCWTEWVDLTAGGTNSIVDAGVFATASELQDYPFADKRWYNFRLEGALGSGLCFGRFNADIEEEIPNYESDPYINFINFTIGKFGVIKTNTGSINYKDPISVDQTYNPESENAQSGKAVAQAINAQLGNIESLLAEI